MAGCHSLLPCSYLILNENSDHKLVLSKSETTFSMPLCGASAKQLQGLHPIVCSAAPRMGGVTSLLPLGLAVSSEL